MEKNVHRYVLEGLELEIPLKLAKNTNTYIEDCSELINHPKYTPSGHPVILTHYEPCELFAGEISDCADCGFFKSADAVHFTLIGICTHQSKRRQEK